MQNGGNPCVASYKSKCQTQECDEWYLLMSQLPGFLKGQKKLRHPLISCESRGAPKCHPQAIKPPFNSHEISVRTIGIPFFVYTSNLGTEAHDFTVDWRLHFCEIHGVLSTIHPILHVRKGFSKPTTTTRSTLPGTSFRCGWPIGER